LLTNLQFQSLSKVEGPAFWFLNNLATVKATTESTGGAFSLVHTIAPAGLATPLHVHYNEDEAFYVLEGAATFFFDGQKTVVESGGYIFLPRGIPHGVRINGSTPATMLIMAMPGNGFVGMMQEMGERVKERILPPPTVPDMERLIKVCNKYGIEVLGPLPD
jgi:quercetin dioxygenase-like cupin family protein